MSSHNPYSPPAYYPPESAPLPPLKEYDPAVYGPPTMVRFGVLGLTATMSILLYLDRFAISVATPVMLVELGIDKQQMGYAISAFFWAYALAQVPSGWLSDTFGGRLMLTLYVVAWSLALGFTGLITSLGGLILVRLLLGIGQAGAYPTAGGFLKNWIPLSRRGISNSIVTTGGRSGGLLSNLVTPQLMLLVGALGVASGQWRLVFALYAVLGLVWAVVFGLWFRNTPQEHAWCNDSERALIEHGRPADTAKPGSPDLFATLREYGDILISPNLWVMCVINFCVNIGWIFLVTWLPTYLKEEYQVELWQAGAMTAFAGLAGMTGNLCGGFSTDFLARRIGLTWGRRVPGLVASGGAALLYAASVGLESLGFMHAMLAATIFAGAYFLIDLGLGAMWATYQDIAGKKVATVLGFTNMCGNIGAAIFASVIGYLAENDNWPRVFMISSGSFLIVALCWLFVNPSVPMSREPQS